MSRFSHRSRNKGKNNTWSIVLQVLIVVLLIATLVTPFIKDSPSYLRWITFGLTIVLIVIQGIRLRCPLLYLDRIFAYSPKKQIALALGAFVITLDLALCLFPQEGIRSAFTGAITTMKLIYVPSEIAYTDDTTIDAKDLTELHVVKQPATPVGRLQYLKHALIYILGLIVFNGLLIATITRVMATRAERYKCGTMTYRNLRNHYLIVGYGDTCIPILRNLWDRDEAKSTPSFLILSNQSPEAIRRSIQTQLKSIANQIVNYSGDINSLTQLKRLNIGQAKEVFVLGEGKEPGRDSKNLECAKRIKELRQEEKTDTVLHINVQLDKPASYSTIKRITLPSSYYKDENGNEVTYIRPFNFYENWARLLWGTFHIDDYRPLDRGLMAEDHHHVHLIIAGFNEMGVALLLEALRVCHYPNYNELTKANQTRITIIDPRMDNLLPVFKAQYPYLDQIQDVAIEYRCCRIEDEEIREMLDRISSSDETLLTIALCFYDSDNSLSSALTLPDNIYYHAVDGKIIPNTNTEILVRQEIRSGLSDVLAEENGKYANVKIFGTLDKGLDDRLLNDKMALIISAYYHFKYDLGSEKNFFELIEEDKNAALKEALANWIALNEDKRFANRYQTEIYGSYQTYRSLFENDPEILYQTEHMRWSAERSITGYRDMHEQNIKNDAFQLHRSIIPYYELSCFEKDKDKDVLVIMDRVMALSESITDNIL